MQKNLINHRKKSKESILIYGCDFDDKPLKLSQIVYKTDEITLQGKVINFETLEIPKEQLVNCMVNSGLLVFFHSFCQFFCRNPA